MMDDAEAFCEAGLAYPEAILEAVVTTFNQETDEGQVVNHKCYIKLIKYRPSVLLYSVSSPSSINLNWQVDRCLYFD